MNSSRFWFHFALSDSCCFITLHLFCSSAETRSRPFLWWCYPSLPTWFLSWCELPHVSISATILWLMFRKALWMFNSVSVNTTTPPLCYHPLCSPRYFFPRQLLIPHFWTPTQQVEFRGLYHSLRAWYHQPLLKGLQDTSFHGKGGQLQGHLNNLCAKVSEHIQLIETETLSYCSVSENLCYIILFFLCISRCKVEKTLKCMISLPWRAFFLDPLWVWAGWVGIRWSVEAPPFFPLVWWTVRGLLNLNSSVCPYGRRSGAYALCSSWRLASRVSWFANG